ncbi:MAG: hypothetical protein WBC34_00820 [Thiofilum sp.]
MSQLPAQLYDLVVTGHTSELKVADLVQQLMTILGKKSAQLEFKLSEALIFEQNSNTALEGVSLEVAEHFQKEFGKALVTTEIRPTIQIVELEIEDDTPKVYRCPACGHEQPSVKDRLDMCDVCGVIGQRYSSNSRLKMVMEDERRRLAQEQAQKVRESLAKAEYQERVKLRRTALKQLGVKEKKQWPIWGARIVGVMAVGGGTYWGYLYLNPPTEDTVVADSEQASDTNKTFTINPALLQGNSNAKISMTDQAIALLDNGLLPDAPAITIANPEALTHSPTLNSAGVSNGVNASSTLNSTVPQFNATTPTVVEATTLNIANTPLLKTHNGRGFEILMKLEELGLADPRFKRSTAQHLVDKDYLDQLLSGNQWGMGKVFIDTLTDSYEQAAMYTYALLTRPDLVNAQSISEKLQVVLQPLPPRDEQRLLLQGALAVVQTTEAKTSPISLNETTAFKQLLGQVVNIPDPEQRIPLLMRLANEQYLFNQRLGAQQLLQLAEQELPSITVEKREALAAHIAASYFIIEDEPSMLRVSEQVNEASLRERLFQGMEQIRPLVKPL